METKFNVGDRPYKVTGSMPDDTAFFEKDRGAMGAKMFGYTSAYQIDPITEITIRDGIVTYICSNKDRPHIHYLEDCPYAYQEEELYATEEEAVAICREKNSKRWELLEEGKKYLERRGLL